MRQQYGNPVLAAALDHEEKRLPIQEQLIEAEQTLLGALGDFFDRYKAEVARPLQSNADEPDHSLPVLRHLLQGGGRPIAHLGRMGAVWPMQGGV